MSSIFQFPLHGLLPGETSWFLFLDHLTSELEERFGLTHQTKVKLFGLIPSIAATYLVASIAEVGALYSADLPSLHLLSTEFSRWKRACVTAPVDKRL